MKNTRQSQIIVVCLKDRGGKFYVKHGEETRHHPSATTCFAQTECVVLAFCLLRPGGRPRTYRKDTAMSQQQLYNRNMSQEVFLGAYVGVRVKSYACRCILGSSGRVYNIE